MNYGFEPEKFLHRNTGRLPIDAAFWTRIKSEKESKLHIPTPALKKDWPEYLEIVHNIKPDIFYDPAISGLILEVTPEMMEKFIQETNKVLIDDDEDNPSPTSITPEEYLSIERLRTFAKISGNNFMNVMGKTEEPLYLSEWEERLLQWREGYGFLVESKDMKGLLFPKPNNMQSLKQEVVREYFFNIPEREYSGIILSLGQEPNSNRAIWGFRRDFATDWPEQLPQRFITEMNELTENLETLLT